MGIVMQLCRLVYYSTYNISSQANEVAADLKQILATAIRSNSENGLSGGLIFNRRFFGQVLEGDHAVVMQTFARIYKDRRHKDIVVVEEKRVSERLFGEWSMGYAGNTELFKTLCAEFGYAGQFDPTRMSGPHLTAFILALVTKEQNFAASQKVAGTLADA
jgi:Sensors of blue-light using FAD